MAQLNNKELTTLPVGRLGLIPLDSCRPLGEKVNEWLVKWRKERENPELGTCAFEGYQRDSYIINVKTPRFGSGEAKGVIKESVGKDEYKPYSSYLLTVFFFILINNLIGIIPVFPGGANITGNIAVTAVLAGCTFIAVNLFATKEYWKDIFWPKAPIYLKLPLPIMPFVEFFGVFTKPFALMIRLFANMMAGHAAILSLISIIFITANMGPLINGSMGFVAVAFGIFMTALELLVAFIQAYVFTMLSAVFIGLSRTEEMREEKEMK